MFTGIVTDIGKIIELEKRGDLRARIQTDYDINTIANGASIACDGINYLIDLREGIDFGIFLGLASWSKFRINFLLLVSSNEITI